jgi:hypothetical protein
MDKMIEMVGDENEESRDINTQICLLRLPPFESCDMTPQASQ